MAALTTSQLLTSIKTRAMLPDSSNGLTDARLLEMATEELQLELLQLIRSVREEFYVTSKSYAVTANQALYAIPSRASGLVLRDVQLISGTSVRSIEPVAREDVTTTQAGSPSAYYFEHQYVVLYPTPSSTNGDLLRLSYFFRPSALTPVSSAASISAIDVNTNTITVNTVPTSWSTGTEVDFVSKTPPYANVAIDQAITGISGSDITFASLPEDLAVGDYVALAEYSPLAQVPVEFQVILAQMTACRALEALGQLDQLQAAEAKLQRYKQAAINLVSPRNEGSLKKVISNNWTSGGSR